MAGFGKELAVYETFISKSEMSVKFFVFCFLANSPGAVEENFVVKHLAALLNATANGHFF